ncbi:PP2C family protein-serine/threonine phosphatase [Spirillospora sp. CA-294931]|uniref:PP2C family protein-serine/threonine phosphatase n=1 Tax=Spirillospora sp. CA-294931 TaxID=3240042 RepID=UPI003D93E707
MPWHDVEHSVWNAEPHELIDTAAAAFRGHFGAEEVEVLLVDYRQASLVPSRSRDESVALDTSSQGRAFASQQIVWERPVVAHVPLAVRGDRIGVLTLRFPERPEAGARAALADAAEVLSRALRIADISTDLYRQIRRRSRLTLAAEMQWDLLPGRSYVTDGFHLAGQLEPAYAVWGDNFDWSVAADRLTLTVSNGMGRGTEAAALTHLGVSALRNARRSGADITEQAALANQTLFAHHRGKRHLSTLLLDFQVSSGRVRVVDAGSPHILRMRGNVTEMIELEAQLPLGMFGDGEYTVEEFAVEPGDRLIIVSDGIHAARSATGDLYGAVALTRALRETRLQNPSEAVRTLIRHFLEYHQGADPADDAVVVCLDWTGKNPSDPADSAGQAPVIHDEVGGELPFAPIVR